MEDLTVGVGDGSPSTGRPVARTARPVPFGGAQSAFTTPGADSVATASSESGSPASGATDGTPGTGAPRAGGPARGTGPAGGAPFPSAPVIPPAPTVPPGLAASVRPAAGVPVAPPRSGVPAGSDPSGSSPRGPAPVPGGSRPAPDGSAPDGSAPDGSAPDGSAPDGSGPEASAAAPDGPSTAAPAPPAGSVRVAARPARSAGFMASLSRDSLKARIGSPGFARRVAVSFAAFLASCTVLTFGLTTLIEHRGGRAEIPATSAAAAVPTSPAPTDPAIALARAAAVRPLLDRRASAVITGRRADWDATLDSGTAGAAFKSRQLAEFDRIRLLPVRAWHYQVIDTTPVSPTANQADAPFVAKVQLGYRLAGDTRDVERTQSVTVERRTTGWALTGLKRESLEADPWELGPLTVTKGDRSIVVGIGRDQDRSVLRRAAQDTDTAASRVDDTWGSAWRRTVVVIVPQTTDALAAILGRSNTTGLDQIAAVTNGELAREARTGAGTADRVVVNPTAYAKLSSTGRKVVLTHELTHVATRASARISVPLWVEEGFASYVAYRGSGLSRATIAADVLPLVRAGTAESRLPEESSFDPADGPVAPVYADSWLAFDLMAQDGSRRPLDFYRVAAGLDPATATGTLTSDEALTQAFQRVLDTDEDTFSDRWRAYRDELAKDSR